jgi:hypothetical protein
MIRKRLIPGMVPILREAYIILKLLSIRQSISRLMERLLNYTGDPVMKAMVLDMMEITLIGFIGMQQ